MLLLDRHERQVLAVLAAGGEIDVDDAMARFDAALDAPAEAETVDPELFETLRSLGLR